MPTRALFADARGAELMQAARVLVSHLDLDEVLASMLEAACRFTGAQYAAIGVLNRGRTGLERFIYRGIDEQQRRIIGDLPKGHGVLGTLIREPHAVRVPDVGRHPDSYGFPPGHPPMASFLGVPIVLRGAPWGNLYLTEKAGGEFDQADEHAAMLLAEWAAIAVDNAHAYELSEERRQALEEAVTALEVTTDIARAVGAEIDLDRILELVVKRGRALVQARLLTISLVDGDELELAAIAGERRALRAGERFPLAGSVTAQVLERGRPMRIVDGDARLRALQRSTGIADLTAALVVPLVFRGRPLGALAAFDRQGDDPAFTTEHERLLDAFAASAATAVATARNVIDDRVRAVLQTEERERARWARELHDDTLQHLAALNLELAALRSHIDDPEARQALERTMRQAQEQVDSLRALITDLRPAGLDDLGLGAALESLVARTRDHTGIDLGLDTSLAFERGDHATRLHPDVEAAAYRLTQEALTNVARHAQATAATVTVHEQDGRLHIEVIDNGRGFDAELPRRGFGLSGMRERVALLGGSFDLDSGPRGTSLHADLPARHRDAPPSAEEATLRA